MDFSHSWIAGYETEEKAASIGLSRDLLASFVLAIETEELGITGQCPALRRLSAEHALNDSHASRVRLGMHSLIDEWVGERDTCSLMSSYVQLDYKIAWCNPSRDWCTWTSTQTLSSHVDLEGANAWQVFWHKTHA